MLLVLAWTACTVPQDSDEDTDVRVPATPDVTPGVDKTAYISIALSICLVPLFWAVERRIAEAQLK